MGGSNMGFSELTKGRRTVHNYKTTPVDDSWVEEALRLALWAPNHKLTFPWAFFWVGPRVRAELADLTVRLKESKEPLSEIKKKAARETVLSPAHLILLGLRRGEPARRHEDYATLACSVQIMMTYFWEKGVGTKWSTGGNYGHPETYKLLGISSEELSLEGGLMIGAPLMIPTAPKRPPLELFLRRTD